MNNQPAFNLQEVSVNYGELTALSNVSLSVPKAQVTAVIGVNGSGKSTLFKTLMGLVYPTAGTVKVFGASVAKARKGGLIGYLPQSEEVDWNFPISVAEVIMTGRYGRLGSSRRAKELDKKAVADAMARLEITELADRQISELSGGQKKRVFFARIIAQEAELVLLDEPFTGVDLRSEQQIQTVITELATEGKTVFLSSHNLSSLPEFASETVLLMKEVLAYGKTAEVIKPETIIRVFGGKQ